MTKLSRSHSLTPSLNHRLSQVCSSCHPVTGCSFLVLFHFSFVFCDGLVTSAHCFACCRLRVNALSVLYPEDFLCCFLFARFCGYLCQLASAGRVSSVGRRLVISKARGLVSVVCSWVSPKAARQPHSLPCIIFSIGSYKYGFVCVGWCFCLAMWLLLASVCSVASQPNIIRLFRRLLSAHTPRVPYRLIHYVIHAWKSCCYADESRA